ncbi:ATP-dependent DNA helicase RuvA [Clostridium carboxidivorans P7]|uniref:Holliday junction branch migration complex subunit RuvA n=1 Tax=Clostridium carboxidivorans P7 TaxID=536227 RepID=C6PXP7_9CLOT|nr:Holliday junction branch migration protein RuvA [Clostridium carboxidivorans]AKN32484.1 ATP-dependent DNA helicase RuvA [Clostridium carboxidivorans P7]EET85974.1 Holliday junction DNA helicase RuvA [Clostridium carboxidivorans P7]EFG87636.1 Holliday junction DNA helicase RuvA [Clostridium carboxidivorans P7]
MYEYIRGTYAGMNKDYIVVENNGIGYKIYTSGSTLAKIPKINEEIMLYLQQIVREDFIGLYGFLTKEELSMFNLLLSINGVGAKAALSLLSISSVNNLKYAILSGDEKLITRAPGIGKKMSQRIILELKDKVKPEDVDISQGDTIEIDETAGNSSEALEALVALGYSEKEANKAINTIDKKDSVENIIRNALKFLMG